MDSPLNNFLYSISDKFLGYLPNLVAELVLLGLGVVLGWIAKRMVFQLCLIFRLDRLFRRTRWGEALTKADVRYAFYESLGRGAFWIIFLVFLDAAFNALQLSALSQLIERGVLVVPRLLVALLIVGVGWMIAGWAGVAVQRALTKEDVPRATLIARFAKSIILLFVSAMALTELDIAREIVIIGFTVVIITLGVLSVVTVTLGGRTAVRKVLASLAEE